MKIGFDNEKYLKIQSEHIRERIGKFGNKLYLELGGKLFDDNHASRVLPGFCPDSKLQMFKQLKDTAEIVIVISAVDIEKNKVRQDLGITYDEDVLRLRKEFTRLGFYVSGVVITHYNGQNSADLYRQRLERLNIKAYYHYTITIMWRPPVRLLLLPHRALAAARWRSVLASSTRSTREA